MSPVHPDTLAALTSGIQSEVATYVFYLAAAKKSFARDIKSTLEKLALEEKEHFHILERQYDSLVRSEKWISTADILKRPGLPEIGEEMTGEHQALIDEVSKARSVRAILDIALRLEKEAQALFVKSAGKVGSQEGRRMFERLAGFEEGHVRLISGMIAELR